MTKCCPKCQITKDLSSFYVLHNGKMTTPWCRSCIKIYNSDPDVKRRAAANKRERMRLKKLDPEYSKKFKDRTKGYYEKARANDPNLLSFNRLRSRARKYDIPFNIDYSDIPIPSTCPILNIPMDRRDRDHTPSYDKIDPTKGYVIGNVAVISVRANRMKDNATLEELKALVKYVESHALRSL